ncbi:hypothetical protein RFI_39904 [Reticulomyxa filosa]|uniref:Uncharacterized protein n=1 Tax=Reticulomyxa filosa TaxID=46433 RepID=X6L833_RETFI|nr:hypothetical protein RFI_39904 [Reticulomyxa filosa]|eukprot:ETN97625.1 hypothetical protein RFI_39904 [Reticulomyxa filosa]
MLADIIRIGHPLAKLLQAAKLTIDGSDDPNIPKVDTVDVAMTNNGTSNNNNNNNNNHTNINSNVNANADGHDEDSKEMDESETTTSQNAPSLSPAASTSSMITPPSNVDGTSATTTTTTTDEVASGHHSLGLNLTIPSLSLSPLFNKSLLRTKYVGELKSWGDKLYKATTNTIASINTRERGTR